MLLKIHSFICKQAHNRTRDMADLLHAYSYMCRVHVSCVSKIAELLKVYSRASLL